MKKWIAVVVMATVPIAAGAVGAFQDKTPTIKQVMGKLHKGAKSQQKVLDTQIKAESPDWDAIQKTTKDFVILGAALEKNDPPKGSKDSWKKQADKYYANAKALDDAAADKDVDKVKAAQKTIGASCKACHSAHREN